jgi:hypothetical protein
VREDEGYFKFHSTVRRQVKDEQKNSCAYCGNFGCVEIHHIVPSRKATKMGWSPEQITARENAVGLCGGEGNCHDTFDTLANDYEMYFDDVMEDEGRPYTLPKRSPQPEVTPAPIFLIPPFREISPLYLAGDD